MMKKNIKAIPQKLSRKKYVKAKKAVLSQNLSAHSPDNFTEILDYDPDAENTVSEPPAPERKRKKGFSRKRYFITGITVIFLSVIGLISVVRFAADKISYVLNNTEQKNEMAKALYPLVICDPAPFDDVSKLSGDTVVTAACWEIILNYDTDIYTKDFDYITVPAADIEQAAADLFGEGLVINHTSIINSDIQFYYNQEKQSYRIPYSPKYFSYSPVIEEISSEGNVYTVEVGCLTPTPSWFAQYSDTEPAPEKYVTYTLRKRSDGYVIVSAAISDKNTQSNSGL